MRNPFHPWFRMNKPGLQTPLAVLLQEANMPQVRAYQPYHEMREDFVQSARTIKHPELYLDGVSLAAMGGEPYSNWN